MSIERVAATRFQRGLTRRGIHATSPNYTTLGVVRVDVYLPRHLEGHFDGPLPACAADVATLEQLGFAPWGFTLVTFIDTHVRIVPMGDWLSPQIGYVSELTPLALRVYQDAMGRYNPAGRDDLKTWFCKHLETLAERCYE